MATAGPSAPGTMADDSAVGATAWSNPGNVAASDNTYATAGAASGTSHYLKCTNFGFAIPSGATINGITVAIERKADASSKFAFIQDSVVKIVKGGTVGGTSKADTATKWPTSDASVNYGGAADLWGNTLTDSDVNASNFGVVLSVTFATATASVDLITITVTYTAGASFSPGWASRSSQIIGGAG